MEHSYQDMLLKQDIAAELCNYNSLWFHHRDHLVTFTYIY